MYTLSDIGSTEFVGILLPDSIFLPTVLRSAAMNGNDPYFTHMAPVLGGRWSIRVVGTTSHQKMVKFPQPMTSTTLAREIQRWVKEEARYDPADNRDGKKAIEVRSTNLDEMPVVLLQTVWVRGN